MKDASAMLKEVARKQTGHQVKARQWSASPQWFILSAGGIFAFAGANNLLDAFGTSQALYSQDPLFGVQFYYILILSGIAQMFIAWPCLFTNKNTLSLGLVAWFVVNFVAYRIGLWTMGWHHPWVFIGGLTDALKISPFLADCILSQVCLFLLAGSLILLLRPQPKPVAKLKPTATPEHITYFKVSCTNCGGKTAFDAQWIGQNIPCPHCGNLLSLNKLI
jgi:hypothetical protein